MAYHKAVSKLMSFSINSYYVWKKENRPIIALLHKYFKEDDINEFLQTGSVSKFDNIEHFQYDFYKSYYSLISNLEQDELVIFLEFLKKNQDNLSQLSSDFINQVFYYECENNIKLKLIKNYSNITDKNQFSYFGLKNMLNDKFLSFYRFSIKYAHPEEQYRMEIKHLKAYLNVFLNHKKFLTHKELFPEVYETEELGYFPLLQDYGYLDYEKKYYEYLLGLL